MTDLLYSIGDLFQWTFGILVTLDNLPNVLFTILITAGLGFWMFTQQRMIKEDRANGRLV